MGGKFECHKLQETALTRDQYVWLSVTDKNIGWDFEDNELLFGCPRGSQTSARSRYEAIVENGSK